MRFKNEAEARASIRSQAAISQISAKDAASRRARGVKLRSSRSKIETGQQILFFQWADQLAFYDGHPLGDYIHHIPNGGHRNIMIAMELKKMGVRRGMPDTHCMIASGSYHSFCGEFKAPDGQLSEEQLEKHAMLRKCGHFVTTEYSASAMAAALVTYLRNGAAGVLTIRHML
jgi:hypothetical protein